jgi:hypothetical protein
MYEISIITVNVNVVKIPDKNNCINAMYSIESIKVVKSKLNLGL